MTPIREQTDNLIRRLKTQSDMQDVRFFREYSEENIETPIDGFAAVVGIAKATQKQDFVGGLAGSGVKGHMYDAEIEIRVYSPYRQNGSGLSELTNLLMTGLYEADEERLITSVSASSIAFDKELNSVYRTIRFTLEFCLCEEGSA